MTHTRRSLLSALGISLPFGLGSRRGASASPGLVPAPPLRFRPLEDAVRAAFAAPGRAATCCTVEVGHSDLVSGGVQNCHNDRPFAGFPAGHLRIVRAGSGPGPDRGGVRLYVTRLDIALADGPPSEVPSRPLDFASLPPAPIFA